jgi:nucleoside-diphosphate-sugar epimerase
MPQATAKTALVIGATGSFGAHAVMALIKRGWTIRGLARDPLAAAAKVGPRMPIEWIKGDAMNEGDVIAAAWGARVIVHAVNPPGYKNWRGLAVPMLRATIAAAKTVRARIVLPGNVYNFAPDAGPAIAEDHAQAPATRKGAIRVEMEEMLRTATTQGAKVLVLRAGDFFGPAAPNSGLGWTTSRRGGRVRGVYSVGPAGVGRAWAYLPDLAETMGRLLEREGDLAPFEVFHFAGHWLPRSDEMALAIRRVTAQQKLPITPFPWIVVYALSPFVEMFRELAEMRYLWQSPIGLDNAKLTAFLGPEPHTPLDAAVRATLTDMGCLPDEQAAPVGVAVAA